MMMNGCDERKINMVAKRRGGKADGTFSHHETSLRERLMGGGMMTENKSCRDKVEHQAEKWKKTETAAAGRRALMTSSLITLI